MEPKIGIRRRVSKMTPPVVESESAEETMPQQTQKPGFSPLSRFVRAKKPAGPGFGGAPSGTAEAFPMLGD